MAERDESVSGLRAAVAELQDAEPELRAWGLADAGAALAQAGEHEAAEACFADAEEAASELDNAAERRQFEAHLEGQRALAESVRTGKKKSKKKVGSMAAYNRIWALLHCGAHEEAADLAWRVRDKSLRAMDVSRVIAALCQAGEVDRAREHRERLAKLVAGVDPKARDGEARYMADAALAEADGCLGDAAAAAKFFEQHVSIERLESYEEPVRQGLETEIINWAQAVFIGGDLEAALKILERVSRSREAARVWLRFATASAENGEPERARELLARWTAWAGDEHATDEPCTRAQIHYRLGEMEQAEALMEAALETRNSEEYGAHHIVSEVARTWLLLGEPSRAVESARLFPKRKRKERAALMAELASLRFELLRYQAASG